jgi:hypothetical protein
MTVNYIVYVYISLRSPRLESLEIVQPRFQKFNSKYIKRIKLSTLGIRIIVCGRDYLAGLRVTKRNKGTVLLTLTLLQTPTLTITIILTLTLI